MFVKATHTAPEISNPTRLYDYAFLIFQKYIPSKKGIKKALKRGEIWLDNKKGKSGDWVKEGQHIELRDLELNPPKPYPLELEIIYEDEYFAVINKPAGISVSGNQFRTIQNAIINQIKVSNFDDALKWPRPVHRLDNQTSGLLVIAKTAKAIINLSKQFENKDVKKTYYALVIGEPEKSGIINLPIDNHKATSLFKTLKTINSIKSNKISLIELEPQTGRTHQLRIHCAKSGFPILGDKLYGDQNNTLLHKGLFLSANKISLKHPFLNDIITLEINTPKKFEIRLKNEVKMHSKLVL